MSAYPNLMPGIRLAKGGVMFLALLVLLAIAVLFGIGVAASAAKLLFWIALVLLVLWAVGWAVGAGASAGMGRRRWYYW